MGFNTFPCNPYPISTDELNKGNNDDLNTRVAALESDVSDLNSNKANQITIAPFFNAETAYTAGDLVYYNGLSYRCTNDHEGAWDADDFVATTIANELDALKSGLNDVTKNSAGTSVDISGATLSEKYTFPADGYIYVSSETDTSGINKTAITGSNGITVAYIYQPISAANDVRSLYVRKGMQFYVVQKSANSAMRFTPLT